MIRNFTVQTLAPNESVVLDASTLGGQLLPTKLFILPHGAEDNGPSYCLLMHDAVGRHWVTQITHHMFVQALKEYRRNRKSMAKRRAYSDTNSNLF